MFEREMMISGLQRQRHLLEKLIQELENRPMLDAPIWLFCNERTKEVANNLRKLRRIKTDYLNYRKATDLAGERN